MRILLADHDVRVRMALNFLLRQEPEEVVIAESSDLESLAVQIREFKSDLLLLDWELPGRVAVALLLALRGQLPPKVIVLSRFPESETAALALGANGFVYKGDSPDHLLTICQQSMAEQNYRPAWQRSSEGAR